MADKRPLILKSGKVSELSSSDTLLFVLRNYFVSASSVISTTSGTFVDTGLQVTIGEAGKYLVIGNAYTAMAANGNTNRAEVGLAKNGTTMTDAKMNTGVQVSGIALASTAFQAPCITFRVDTFAANDVIKLQYRRVGGLPSTEVYDRQLVAIRLE